MKRRFLSLFACLMALAVVFSAGSAVLADDAPIVGNEGELIIEKDKVDPDKTVIVLKN